MDFSVPDVLDRVRPGFVVHHMPVRDLGLHNVVTHVDLYLPTADEVDSFIGMRMLGVLMPPWTLSRG
jgi:hypothetical protein